MGCVRQSGGAAGAFAEAVSLSREAEQILREAGDELGATYAAQSLAKASVVGSRSVSPVTTVTT